MSFFMECNQKFLYLHKSGRILWDTDSPETWIISDVLKWATYRREQNYLESKPSWKLICYSSVDDPSIHHFQTKWFHWCGLTWKWTEIQIMMMLWQTNTFWITAHLWGESISHYWIVPNTWPVMWSCNVAKDAHVMPLKYLVYLCYNNNSQGHIWTSGLWVQHLSEHDVEDVHGVVFSEQENKSQFGS